MFRLFFGSPGAGKTTTAVALMYKDLRSHQPLYDYHFSNFDCGISRYCSLDGLGSWTFPERSYVAVDEAGIVFNNRRWEKMPQSQIEWMKKHRHYGVDMDFFSQSWEDCDTTIRRLVDEVWHLKKIGPFTLCRRIKKRVDIDEKSHQPLDMYYKLKMIKRFLPPPFNDRSFFLVYRPKYYKFFDTYERKPLPIQHFGSSDPDQPISSRFITIFRFLFSKFKCVISARPPELTDVGELSTADRSESDQGGMVGADGASEPSKAGSVPIAASAASSGTERQPFSLNLDFNAGSKL